MKLFRSVLVPCAAILAAAVLFPLTHLAQSFDSIERGRMKDMLKAVRKEIKSDYYDPQFKGVDLDAKFDAANEKLNKATSTGQALGIIAQAVLELDDSHTTFYPPARTTSVEYGWRSQMIGDKCFVIAVKPRSEAEKMGLKVGDEILTLENFRPTRKDLWKMNYYYNSLSPRAGLTLKIQSPGEKEPRMLNIPAKITHTQAKLSLEALIREIELNTGGVIEHRFIRVGNTMVWKHPSFSTEPEVMDTIMKDKIGSATNLIIDLRGNGGGYVVTLERLAGYFVDEDTKIADLKGRKEMKPMLAKSRGKDAYRGKLIVLVDSGSGSASEIFARFMQLQQRGVVIGDQSSGAVMQSRTVPMSMGVDSIVPYGMSVTNADVLLADGVSLEHIGVTPQLVMMPTGEDLALGRDPVLAAALKLFEQDVSPESAGKMFPFKWKDD